MDRSGNFLPPVFWTKLLIIKQECIEQDKPHEKELAVQAMDLVYLEAHISIGLLQSHLQQKHLDALLFIYKAIHTNPSSKHGRSAFRGPQSLDLATLAEAVSLIVNDGWNTRAWVLQVRVIGLEDYFHYRRLIIIGSLCFKREHGPPVSAGERH